MGDYSGIGEAMVFLAVVAAFAVPALIGGFCGMILMAFGFKIAGVSVAALGFAAGIACAIYVRRSA